LRELTPSLKKRLGFIKAFFMFRRGAMFIPQSDAM